jgi:integrase
MGQRLSFDRVSRLGFIERLPCIHDLRHGFAIKSLEQCSGDSTEVSRHITALSTYLGHAHVSDTYWYLQATPSLMEKIAVTQENFFGRKSND